MSVQFGISDPMPTAEIIPHPQMRIRFAQERLRHVSDIKSTFNQRRLLKDAVVQYRKSLQQLSVKPERVAADVEALEVMFFGPPVLRRRA